MSSCLLLTLAEAWQPVVGQLATGYQARQIPIDGSVLQSFTGVGRG